MTGAASSEKYPRIVTLITAPRSQIIFAIFALGVILLSIVVFYTLRPYDGMNMDFYRDNHLWVEAVHSGGPAEKARIMANDWILSIGGRPVNSLNKGPVYELGIRPGDVVVYELERGPQIVTLSVTVGSYFDNLPQFGRIVGVQLVSLIFGVAGLVMCLYVQPHDVRARLIGLTWLLIGMSIAATGPTGWTCLAAYTTMMVTSCLVGFTFVAAHLYFPIPSLTTSYRKYMIYGLAAVALLLSALTILEDWVLNPRGLAVAHFVGMDIYDAVSIWELSSFLAGTVLLVRNHFRAKDSDVSRQTGVIMWGTVLGYIPFIAVVAIEPFLHLSSFIYTYAMLPAVVIPLAYAYVIYQRRLLRIDFVVNRIIVFFVLAWVTFGIFVLSLGIITRALGLAREIPLMGGALAAFLSPFFEGLRKAVRRRVNQVLYGCDYDFYSVTSGFSSRLVRAVDRNMLIDFLTQDLSHQMGIRQAALFLAEGDSLQLQCPEAEPCSFPVSDELLTKLLDSQEPMRTWDLGQLAPTTQATWRRFAWVQLFAPIIFEGRLDGVLLLGRRFSGDVYSNQDVHIIDTVARQGALAFANVRLVETLRGLNQQLVRADEAHRKQVARDLHDTVLQQLFLVKQHLLRDRAQATLVNLLDESIQTLRRTIQDQRPPFLDHGLQLALQSLVEEMRKLAGHSPIISWHSNINGRLALSDEQATALYRIAQEALANALKHARAQSIVVTLLAEADSVLRLDITDDGAGMSSSTHGLWEESGIMA
jgi:signal transduction histidine kinase